jgi:SAM-dependent methyltransferase
MLTTPQYTLYRDFLANYRPLRQVEGWERPGQEYYLDLPTVKPHDPQAAIWRIRKRSFRRVQQIVKAGAGKWALDLGAGNGWLSRHLVKMGFKVVSLDLNASGPDSLEGAQLYHEHDGIWFGRVQASMEQLPFKDGCFGLCIASGSLHYAGLEKTLGEVWRVLANDSRFILTDSPLYRQTGAGQAMIEEFRARVKSSFGQKTAWTGGAGFLEEADLWDRLERQGFAVQSFPVERPLGWLKRRAWHLFRPQKREEARFPVILGRKPG